MNRPVKLALVLLAVAVVLALAGLLLAALRWLLYVAVVVLLIAGAVKWFGDRDNSS